MYVEKNKLDLTFVNAAQKIPGGLYKPPASFERR